MRENNQEIKQEDTVEVGQDVTPTVELVRKEDKDINHEDNVRYLAHKNDMLDQNAQLAGSIMILSDLLHLQAIDPEAREDGYMAKEVINVAEAIKVLAKQLQHNWDLWDVIDTGQRIDNSTAESVKAVLNAELKTL